MATKKKNENQDKGLETIESTLTKGEQFIEKNQNYIMYAVFAVVVIIGLYWAFLKYHKEPREDDAKTQMFVAEQNFAADSFQLALNGNMNYPGFVTIIEDYSGTKAANLANYYTGVCYMNLGEYDKAIEYLQDFKTKDLLLGSQKYGIIGDAYVEKDDFQNAIKFYKQAVKDNFSNDFSTPIYLFKLGLVYEELQQYEDALSVFENIYYNFPKSNEARTIEKYIERVKLNI